ncbi:hypothetical protein [Bacillus benzoevorans]|uniref:Uncharacterized protein n=1 Tax=Bacillus benzoevorans TaxID=1456 RepID=A0A7X0LVR3_9BACI|nr:hypothetical protein [Bacillus benzoevorans]MBB6445795.1 hypothetical protein [Bacillus benzoevorans]
MNKQKRFIPYVKEWFFGIYYFGWRKENICLFWDIIIIEKT